MRERIFNPNITHSLPYYKAVLLGLIAGNTENLTHKQIADRFNSLRIKTSAGLEWTSENVKGVFKRLRNHHEYPNKLHRAMLELVYTNELTKKQTLPLFEPRLYDRM